MKIVVHFAAADLRGMAFELYAAVLYNMIDERFTIPLAVDEIDISPGNRTRVLFEGLPSTTEDAAEIVAMGREITGPGRAGWVLRLTTTKKGRPHQRTALLLQ